MTVTVTVTVMLTRLEDSDSLPILFDCGLFAAIHTVCCLSSKEIKDESMLDPLLLLQLKIHQQVTGTVGSAMPRYVCIARDRGTDHERERVRLVLTINQACG